MIATHDVLGTPIAITTASDLAQQLEERLPERAVVVNVCNVHSIVSARHDSDLAEALANGDVNTADGMPLVWFLRSEGIAAERVNGASILERVISHGLELGWRHFFYGSTPSTLDLMRAALRERYPSIEIAGMVSPPFDSAKGSVRRDDLEEIRKASPDVVWVGLGMPKQELWMHAVRDALPGVALIGVGAVFDFVAGTKPTAPRWMQERGLEWAFRLATEPRRLFRRYASTNPIFLALWARRVALRIKDV